MTKRAESEAYIYKYIDKLLPGGGNVEIYQGLFASMSDTAYGKFMQSLLDGTERLALVVPNLGKVKMSTERNFAVAKELGHNFYQRIVIDNGDGSPPFLTPIAYLVIDLVYRRQAQFQEKKVSIPEDNRSIDDLTGQPTGSSKGSKISYPEVQIMASDGYQVSLEEFLKWRGGDKQAFDAMNASIARTGKAEISVLAPLAGKVRSTETLHILLTGMHIKNTL